MPRFNPSDYDPNNRGEFTTPPEGDYPFVVVGADEKTSQAGNEMLNLHLAVDVGREKDLNVYCNLIFMDKMLGMIHDFCVSTGCDFSTGELTPYDVQGLAGVAHFAKGNPKSNGKSYLEVKYFKASAGYSEQPRQGGERPSRRIPITPPTQPASAAAPAMSTDDRAMYGDPDGADPNTLYNQANDAGGDDIPF